MKPEQRKAAVQPSPLSFIKPAQSAMQAAAKRVVEAAQEAGISQEEFLRLLQEKPKPEGDLKEATL